MKAVATPTGKSSKTKPGEGKKTENSVIRKAAKRAVRLKSAVRAGRFAASGE